MASTRYVGSVVRGYKSWGRRRFLSRCSVLAAAFLAAAFIGAPGSLAQTDAKKAWLIAYEVLPPAGKNLPGLVRATYQQKAKVTQDAAERLVPKVMRLVGGDTRLDWTRLGPGGHAGETNPSIYTSVSATKVQAERIAAALGYVMRQSGVLVANLNDPKGRIAMVEVNFGSSGLTPLRAAGFLRAANLTLSSNDLGYSALDDRMIFLNIGTGIEDDAFHAGLAKTAVTFPPPPAVSELKRATAIFLTNNWSTAPDGEAYAVRLGGTMSNVVLNLRQLRREHRSIIDRAAKLYSWR